MFLEPFFVAFSQVCLERCHAGHDIGEHKEGRFYCDCGLKPCSALSAPRLRPQFGVRFAPDNNNNNNIPDPPVAEFKDVEVEVEVRILILTRM